jgi:hypothetical protein
MDKRGNVSEAVPKIEVFEQPHPTDILPCSLNAG